MSTIHSSSRRGGFSLIEVAIALAIFVFGALAIVQIFPPALGVIRNNENRTTATQMSESTLARMSAKNTPPPEAVFDVLRPAGDTTQLSQVNNYYWNDYPAAVVGTITKNVSLPNSPEETAISNSALGHFRFIYGEPHYIGAGQTVFTNHPFDDSLGEATGFYDQIVDGVQISANGYLDFANAYLQSAPETPFYGSGATDPADASSRRPPDTARREDGVTYYVSYRWRDSTSPNIIRGVIEEPLSIPFQWTGDSARVLPCAVNSANKAVPGAVRVRMRKSVQVTSSGSATGIVSVTASDPGIYYINYFAKDWRNLTMDSAPVNNVVELPINGIETDSVYGVLTNSNYTMTPIPSTTPYPIAAVDYKKGAVKYSFPDTPGARIRTTYRTIDGWAHQPSVAPRSYIPYIARPTIIGFTTANFPREPWREYVWSEANSSNLYFHPSEAGKTVSVSFGYVDGGTYRVVNQSVITIRETIEDAPGTIPATFFGNGNTTNPKVARAEITNLSGNTVNAAAILAVQGLSIQARTAWQFGDRYNQVIVPGYRTLMQ